MSRSRRRAVACSHHRFFRQPRGRRQRLRADAHVTGERLDPSLAVADGAWRVRLRAAKPGNHRDDMMVGREVWAPWTMARRLAERGRDPPAIAAALRRRFGVRLQVAARWADGATRVTARRRSDDE